jgi:hypothetical protein
VFELNQSLLNGTHALSRASDGDRSDHREQTAALYASHLIRHIVRSQTAALMLFRGQQIAEKQRDLIRSLTTATPA